MITIRSAMAKASDCECVTYTKVMPSSRCKRVSTPCMRMTRWASNADSGSSSNRTCGSVTSERARATRWRCPPDSVSILRSANSPISSRSSQSSARLRRSAASILRILSPNSTFSRAFRKGNRASDCQTMGVSRSWTGTSFIRRPPMHTSPSVGASSPAIIRSVVVLPQPDGPMIAMNSPAAISRSRRCTAVKSPNRLTTPERITSGAVMCARPAR